MAEQSLDYEALYLAAKRAREDAERAREDAERAREDAERAREDAVRAREDAEKRAADSLPQQLEQFLESCHELQLAIEVETDRSLTTQGETTDPTGRIFPPRILPWNEFPQQQGEIWRKIENVGHINSRAIFPTKHQLAYVRNRLSRISSEIELRSSQRDTLENPVQTLIEEIYADKELRRSLGLRGTITFESHANSASAMENLTAPMEEVTIGEGVKNTTEVDKAPPVRRVQRPARGRGNRADQFCIYRTSDGRRDATVAIEFKAPHKLPIDVLVEGLKYEIHPERDVIHQEDSSFTFSSRRLCAAVITQLFSYMIGRGIQYGYVCTGQAFIQLHIPSDPSIVYQILCVPSLDVMEDDPAKLRRTAVAQVAGLVLQALQVPPPPMSWHDAAAKLDTWAVEFEEILRDTPKSNFKSPEGSLYKAKRWDGDVLSRRVTRSQCRPPDNPVSPNYKGEGDEGGPASPSPQPKNDGAQKPTASTRSEKYAKGTRKGAKSRQRIESFQYCTSQCMQGLAFGGPIDTSCPNAHEHREQHLQLSEFLHLVRDQLARDRGADADCVPIRLAGAIGAMFKIRLSSHGYVLLAKAARSTHSGRLRRELHIYQQLSSIQGRHVPVCLGKLELILPLYYDGPRRTVLLLSYGGRPLLECMHEVRKPTISKEVKKAYEELHRCHVLHGDAALRNILWRETAVIIDFERAEYRAREPLGLSSPSTQNMRGVKWKRNDSSENKWKQSDDLEEERRAILGIKSLMTSG